MKQFILLSWALLLCCATLAQGTFMKMFRATGTTQQNLNELSSGSLLAGMGRQSGVSYINSLGQVIYSHNFRVDTFLILQSVERFSDNAFFFTGGYRKDLCDSTGLSKLYPMIGVMDSLGNVSAAWHYALSSSSCANMTKDIEVLDDGITAWGTDPYYFLLLRTDLSGQPLWARRFSQSGSFQFIKELPNGDLLAGINMDTAGAVVARLDADGNFLWCKSYVRPLGRVHDAIVETDGSFLVTGFTEVATTNAFEPYPPTFNPKLFLLKLNGSGDVQWCRGYGSAPFHWFTPNASRIVRASDGNFTVLANIGVPTQNFHYRPWLAKMNPNGDTLWTRSSGHVNYSYETRNLLAYSDGSYIFNGRIWGTMPDGTQNNWAYLYKTDSLGHLPCFEVHYPVVISELFPVDSTVTLTSYDGAERRPAFVNDTIYDPIVVYDACTFTTNLPPQAASSRRPMSVRPNPNTGHFTLSFSDPLMAESYYSVYDTMGKLLFQRPLPQGKATEEVDLSRFGVGTYVVRFTNKDGTWYERVLCSP